MSRNAGNPLRQFAGAPAATAGTATEGAAPPPTSRLVVGGIGAIVAIILVAFVLAAAWQGIHPPVPTPVPTAAPTATPQPTPIVVTVPVPVAIPAAAQPTATPSCHSAAQWLDTIAAQERQAQWFTAAANAKTALTEPALCGPDRATLQEKHVQDSREAIFAEVYAPNDVSAGQRSVAAYQAVEGLARQYGVQLPAYRQGAERAYQSSKFALAAWLWEQALAHGEVSAQDREQVRFYESALVNLGDHYTRQSGPSERYDLGVRYLVTAYRIDRQYQLGDNAAWGKLTAIYGPDESTWPTGAVPTPLPSAGS